MIREITIEDKDRYYKLGSILNSNFIKLFALEREIAKDSSSILVYVDDNIVQGFIEIDILPDFIDIINIVVDPSNRKKGIGTQLINYISTNYLNKPINLEVSKENLVAINFYNKLGFKEIGIRKNYYEGIDAIRMVK